MFCCNSSNGLILPSSSCYSTAAIADVLLHDSAEAQLLYYGCTGLTADTSPTFPLLVVEPFYC